MKLERISALVQARPLQGRAHERAPVPGESLLLTYGESADADRIATLSNGMTLRLTGLAQWQNELRPGDALRVRVLATEPVLELEVESGPIGKPNPIADDDSPAKMTRHAAMRLDQAVLRQMTWQVPNPAALAKSWHDLAVDRWGAQLSPRRSGSASQTTMIGPPPFREPASAVTPVVDRWLLPVYAWGGVQMLLGLLYGDQRERKERTRRRQSPLLRLELAPPALGFVVLHVQWLAEGIDLSISVQPHAAQLVSDALPKIAEALSLAALVVADLRVMQDDVQIARFDMNTISERPGLLAPPRSSLALFRALTETAVVLLQLVP